MLTDFTDSQSQISTKLAEAGFSGFSDQNSDAVCFPYKILSGKVEVKMVFLIPVEECP